MTLALDAGGTLVALRIGVPLGLLAFGLIALRGGHRSPAELEESMIIAPAGGASPRQGAPEAPSPPSLVLRTAQGPRRIEVGTSLLVGRAADAGLTLPDDTFASTRHALLERRGGDLWVTDLGSTNGTYVDGERIQTCRLRPGQTIVVGETVLEVQP